LTRTTAPHEAYRTAPDGATMPLEARRAVETAFLRIMRARYPGTTWALESREGALV
jgi:hypothetical protein